MSIEDGMTNIAKEVDAATARLAPNEARLSQIDGLTELIARHLNWGPINGDDRLRFMVLAMCGEAGELANLVKKEWRGDGGDADARRRKMVGEVVDIANYAFMTAAHLGVDLPALMVAKLLEVEKRPEFMKGNQ